MLRWRLLLGTLLIAALAGLCWLDARSSVPGAWLMPLALLIAVLGSGELIWMMRQGGFEPQAGLVYAGNFAIVFAAVAQTGKVSLFLATVIVSALMNAVQRYQGPGHSVHRLGATSFALVYIGVLLASVVQLRLVGHGILPLVSMIAVVKLCDIGAYTVGRLAGRHKMTPVLSPGKTWEGAAGGVVLGCAGAWLVLTYATGTLGAATSLGYGALISIAGVGGDLAESLLKRDLGVKDSSAWLPGFGGVLDIVDSILFTAPIAVIWWETYASFMAM